MRPGYKHSRDQSFLKKYEKLGWVIHPVNSGRIPIIKRFNPETQKTDDFGSKGNGLGRLLVPDSKWDWTNKFITDAALSCGDSACSIEGHTWCSSDVTAIDFDKLKDKDPKDYSDGVEAFKKIIMSEWSLTMKELDQVPVPLLKTRSGGYHLYFQYEPTLASGTNRMVKGTDGKIPLVDVKSSPHSQITIPMGKDSDYKWIVAPWDVDLQPISKELKSKFLHKDSTYKDPTYTPCKEDRASIEQAKQMVDILNQTTVDDYKQWHTIGWSIAGEFGEQGKEVWDLLCSRFSGLQENHDRKWEEYLVKPLPLGIGLLKSWARRDNPLAYAEIFPVKLKLSEHGFDLDSSLTAEDINEYDVSLYLAKILKGSLYFISKLKTWIYYNEPTKLWEVTQSRDIICTFIAETVSNIFWVEEQKCEKTKERDKLTKRKVKFMSMALLNRLLGFLSKHMKDDDILRKIGSSTDLFPLANGDVLDLRHNTIRPRVKEDYFSWASKCEMGYHDHKVIRNYIHSLFPDEQEREYIQVLSGLLLSGQLEKHFWIFTGDTDSGKSTFLNLIATVINQQSYLKTEMIRKGRGRTAGQADPDLLALTSLRAGIFAESGEKDRFDSYLLKKLTGEQSIPVRGLFQQESSLDLYVKLILACNPCDSPDFNILDKAVVRRLVYVRFSQSFEKDPNIEKLYKNQFFLNHLLAWMSYGAWKYYQEKSLPPVPPAFREQKEAAIEVQDSVKTFIIEGPYQKVFDNKKRVANINMYSAYREFCISYSIFPLDATKFKQSMINNGFQNKRTNAGNYWFGVEEKPDEPESSDDEEDNGN